MAADPCNRVAEVREELDWLLSVEDEACRLTDLFEKGELPLRVTHNDTKINNVLFDEKTHEALVVIDLDTVMPGLVGHDFGDAIRFAANFVEEDCDYPEKAGVNLNIFWAFAEGFLKKTAASLTKTEVDTRRSAALRLPVSLQRASSRTTSSAISTLRSKSRSITLSVRAARLPLQRTC